MGLITLWEFKASDGACGRCQGWEGTYAAYPGRPHQNCKCTIYPTLAMCVGDPDEASFKRPAGTWEKYLGVLTPGDSMSITVATSVTSEEKITGKVVEWGESETTSHSTTTNISHDGSCEGNEHVYAEYTQSEITKYTFYSGCVDIYTGDELQVPVLDVSYESTWDDTSFECIE